MTLLGVEGAFSQRRGPFGDGALRLGWALFEVVPLSC